MAQKKIHFKRTLVFYSDTCSKLKVPLDNATRNSTMPRVNCIIMPQAPQQLFEDGGPLK